MKHTIYTKMLISYLIYGVIAFFIICTFTQHLTTDYIEKQEASNLYREASIIAGDYAAEYFGSSMSLSDFQNHMKNIELVLLELLTKKQKNIFYYGNYT